MVIDLIILSNYRDARSFLFFFLGFSVFLVAHAVTGHLSVTVTPKLNQRLYTHYFATQLHSGTVVAQQNISTYRYTLYFFLLYQYRLLNRERYISVHI